MLAVPYAPEYGWRLHTHAGRPANNWGATVTPGNNTKGLYAQVIAGASVPFDVWAISVWINSNAVTAAARDALVDIGVDTAGGTTYTVTIPDLSGAGAATFTGGNVSTRYYFPLFIKAGSSIAARASVNNATVATLRVFCILYGKPKYPDATLAGSSVQAIGVTAATSAGTAVTPGTTSDGAWQLLGTLSRDAWWWQVGLGINDTTISTATYSADLSAGAAGGAKMVLQDAFYFNTSNEVIQPAQPVHCYREAVAGNNVYGRAQCSTTADTAVSMIAYALA